MSRVSSALDCNPFYGQRQRLTRLLLLLHASLCAQYVRYGTCVNQSMHHIRILLVFGSALCNRLMFMGSVIVVT